MVMEPSWLPRVESLKNFGFLTRTSRLGTNGNLSWVLFLRLPFFVNLMAADVFDATSRQTIRVLTVAGRLSGR